MTSTVGTSVAAPRRRRRKPRLVPYLLLAPYLLLSLMVFVGPTAYAIVLSFTKDGGLSLDNWSRVATDYRLLPAIGNVASYLVQWLPAMIIIVLTLAILMQARPGKFSATMRSIYFIPGAITGAAAALLWLFMVTPDVSPFGPLFGLVGIDTSYEMVSDYPATLFALIGVAIHAGGWIVVIYGALRAISPELIEAGRMDGANAFQQVRYLKIPMIKRYILFMTVVAFANGSQVFVEPSVVAAGSPGRISQTWSINQLSYYFATSRGDFGAAAALSLGLMSVGVILGLYMVFRTDYFNLKERG